MSTAATVFQRYYDSRHSGRRLTWQGNLGTADVKVRFKTRSHDLNVSTHALIVLLLFEDVKDDEVLSYTVSASSTSTFGDVRMSHDCFDLMRDIGHQISDRFD